jgi:chromosome segregation ATPase
LIADEQSGLDVLRAELAVAKQSLEQKDTALDTAFARAAEVQRQFHESEMKLSSAEAEIESLRLEIESLSSQKAESEARVQRARGEVAGELALLTSTMIKLREDTLSQANARIATLTKELDALRAERAGDKIEQPA